MRFFKRKSKNAEEQQPLLTRSNAPSDLGSLLTDPLESRGKSAANPLGAAERSGQAKDMMLDYAKKGTVAAAAGGGVAGTLAATGNSELISPASSDGAAVLSLAMAGKGLYDAKKAKKEATEFNDEGGKTIANENIQSNALGLAKGGVSAAKSGLGTAKTAVTEASGAASNAAEALSVAGAVTGIAGGAINLAHTAYQGKKNFNKFRRAKKAKVQTAKGKEWQARVKNRTKMKGAIHALKAAGAGLGIAAGILALASNPVGWALGISAAAVGGAVAAAKIGNKVKNHYARKKVNKNMSSKMDDSDKAIDDLKADPAQEKALSKDQQNKQRLDLKKQADEVAAKCSTNARIASEIISAMNDQDAPEHNDAKIMLGVLKVKEPEALSASGQELIEKRLSAMDGV